MFLDLFFLSEVIVQVWNSTTVLKITRDHKLSPGLRKCGPTTILAELDLFLQLVVSSRASSVLLCLVWPGRRNGGEFVESNSRIQENEKLVKGYSALVPAGFGIRNGVGGDLNWQISSVSRGRLGNSVGGLFESELSISHVLGNIGRETEEQDSHGIHKITF